MKLKLFEFSYIQQKTILVIIRLCHNLEVSHASHGGPGGEIPGWYSISRATHDKGLFPSTMMGKFRLTFEKVYQ